MATRWWGLFSLYTLYRKLKKSSRKKLLDWVKCNLAGMLLWWPSNKIVQALMICKKNMAPRGRGLFSVYICIENFKILLARKTWPISVLLGWNVALVTHYQDCSSNHDSSKDIAARGGAYFPYIFLNRKLLKSSCQKLLKWFQYNLAGMFLWWPSTKFVQAVMILQKHGL